MSSSTRAQWKIKAAYVRSLIERLKENQKSLREIKIALREAKDHNRQYSYELLNRRQDIERCQETIRNLQSGVVFLVIVIGVLVVGYFI